MTSFASANIGGGVDVDTDALPKWGVGENGGG